MSTMKRCRTTPSRASSSEPQRRYLQYAEAAQYINGTEWFVRTLYWKGEIRPSKVGKRHVFDKLDLDAYMARAKGAQ